MNCHTLAGSEGEGSGVDGFFLKFWSFKKISFYFLPPWNKLFGYAYDYLNGILFVNIWFRIFALLFLREFALCVISFLVQFVRFWCQRSYSIVRRTWKLPYSSLPVLSRHTGIICYFKVLASCAVKLSWPCVCVCVYSFGGNHLRTE